MDCDHRTQTVGLLVAYPAGVSTLETYCWACGTQGSPHTCRPWVKAPWPHLDAEPHLRSLGGDRMLRGGPRANQ